MTCYNRPRAVSRERVGPANRLANDSVANDKHHTEVDDLFAQWDSDPLELLSLPDLGA
jgi:hypothetical protein